MEKKHIPEMSLNYFLWQATFKPQSQSVINIVLITGIVLAMAEIVWFVVEKFQIMDPSSLSQNQKIIQMHILHDEYIKAMQKEKEKLLTVSVPIIEIRDGNRLTFKMDDKIQKAIIEIESSIEFRIRQIKHAFKE